MSDTKNTAANPDALPAWFRWVPADAPHLAPVNPRHLLAATLLPCLLVLPFLFKPFHIDDPLFVWTAKHILQHPLSFYGFEVNWWKTDEPMYRVMQNPPLLAYWLAPFGALLGFHEWLMHLVMLPFTALAGAGMYLLAARFSTRPLLATLLVVLSPAFLVSATQVMSDVPMVALWLWAMLAWLRGLERNENHWCLAGGVLILLGALTKYFAAALVPLLLVYTLLQGPSRWRHLNALLIPIAGLAAYEFACHRIFGVGLLADAYRFTATFTPELEMARSERLFNTITFLGGCYAPFLFIAPWLWSRRTLLIGSGLALSAAVLSRVFDGYSPVGIYVTFDSYLMRNERYFVHAAWTTHLQWGIWFIAGVSLLAMAALTLRHRCDSHGLLLLLWIGGTLFFVGFINHFVNARVLLPAGLPLAVLAVAQLDRRHAAGALPALPLRAALAVAGVLALVVAMADYSLASSQKRAAQTFLAEYKNEQRTLWFTGHYGWQYYLEQGGARAADPNKPLPVAGDVFLLPSNNAWTLFPENRYHRAEVRHFPVFPLAATVRHYYSAGFYADAAGPLPFALGWIAPEEYTACLVAGTLDDEVGFAPPALLQRKAGLVP